MRYFLANSYSCVNILSPVALDNPYYKRRKKCQKILKIKQRLAWKVLSELCANLVKFLKEIITSEEFLARHRQSDKNFIRNRIIPFPVLIFFLMNLIKGSLQDELDYFFKALSNLDVAARIVTKSAFCKARKRLNNTAFIELTENGTDFVSWLPTDQQLKSLKLNRWRTISALGIPLKAIHAPWPESRFSSTRSTNSNYTR